MYKLLLATLLFANAVFAGPLRFHPDTIRTGDGYWGSKVVIPESTKVVNTSGSYATVTISSLVSELSHASDQVMFNGPRLAAFAYSADSSIKTGTRFRQPLSRAKNFSAQGRWDLDRNFNTQEIRLAPHDSVVLGVFRFKTCLLMPVRALATTNPVTACRDEPVDLVFGTSQQGFDTLHVRENHWSNGMGGVTPTTRQFSSTWEHRLYSLDGKSKSPAPATITVNPSGATLRLH